MAYARGLLKQAPSRLSFAATHPIGIYGRLAHEAVLRFLDQTEERWETRGFSSPWQKRRFITRTLAMLRPHRIPSAPGNAPRIYLQASHSNLTETRHIGRIMAREQARFVCLIHDLIPIEFPEYGRIDGAAKHEARIRTVAIHASGIIANSHATLNALERLIGAYQQETLTTVAHLGTRSLPQPPTVRPLPSRSRPYFVCIGTIEPRKNHLLLLNLWRRFAAGATPPPKLIIIGRRGWENEQVVDMLERCTALRGHVEEHNGMADAEAAAVLAGAQALLLPSFAEGYGMPVTEALSMGVPVICSDLAALREAGGAAPEYLDPLDGLAWAAAIESYSTFQSPARDSQLKRIVDWCGPTWEEHVAAVLDFTMRVSG